MFTGGGVKRMTFVSGEYHSEDGEETICMSVERFAEKTERGTCCRVPGSVASFAPNQIVSSRMVGRSARWSRFARHWHMGSCETSTEYAGAGGKC